MELVVTATESSPPSSVNLPVRKSYPILQVVDVQGVKCEDKYMMTDPAVHCLKFQPKFGTTNLSHEGMK